MNEEIFLQLRNELYRFLYQKHGRDEAADIIQEVYLRWQKMYLPKIENPRAFLFTIALNIIRDKVRRQAHAQEYAVAVKNLFVPQCVANDPAQHYEEREQLDCLLQALNQLSEKERYAFLLSRYDRLTHATIAKQLDISKKSVARYIQHASECCLAALAQYRS